MQGTIFIYGNDVMLVTTRRMIFEKAGYTVFTAENISDAMLLLINHPIDLLVLCQSVNDDECRSILETAHAVQPEIKCVSLSFNGGDIAMDGVSTYRGVMTPTSLLAAIGQMLQKTAPTQANRRTLLDGSKSERRPSRLHGQTQNQ
jgi:DNA-binding NtrC family response regulator